MLVPVSCGMFYGGVYVEYPRESVSRPIVLVILMGFTLSRSKWHRGNGSKR